MSKLHFEIHKKKVLQSFVIGCTCEFETWKITQMIFLDLRNLEIECIDFNRTSRNRKLVLRIYNIIKLLLDFLLRFYFLILIKINFDKRILDKLGSIATFVRAMTFILNGPFFFLMYLASCYNYRLMFFFQNKFQIFFIFIFLPGI